jgi:hypothetical protein
MTFVGKHESLGTVSGATFFERMAKWRYVAILAILAILFGSGSEFSKFSKFS